jgi:hypothetical protein
MLENGAGGSDVGLLFARALLGRRKYLILNKLNGFIQSDAAAELLTPELNESY